jgi:hypothetical protein
MPRCWWENSVFTQRAACQKRSHICMRMFIAHSHGGLCIIHKRYRRRDYSGVSERATG